MWKATTQSEAGGRILRIAIDQDGVVLQFADVLRLWRDDADFRTFFNELLAAAPFSAFRWETPAITATTRRRDFECVLLNSPGLATIADPSPFAAQFRDDSHADVLVFANLGRDAVLIVPRSITTNDTYGHIAAFVRTAPAPQIQQLWQVVAQTMLERLGDEPVWLSTAGGGVPWLHVRLDSWPKYYGYAPYRTPPN